MAQRSTLLVLHSNEEVKARNAPATAVAAAQQATGILVLPIGQPSERNGFYTGEMAPV